MNFRDRFVTVTNLLGNCVAAADVYHLCKHEVDKAPVVSETMSKFVDEQTLRDPSEQEAKPFLVQDEAQNA